MLGFLMLVSFNNYLAVFLNLLAQKRFEFFLIPIGILTFISTIENTRHFIIELSSKIGVHMLNGDPFFFGILLSLIIAVLFSVRRFLSLNFYIDAISKTEPEDNFSNS